MTEFEPLRETSASAFERALLQSAERDEPSPRAFTRAATALGVGGALLSSAANTSAAVGSGAALATFWTMALKPLLIGAAGGLVVAVSAHKLSSPRETLEPPEVVVSAPAPSETTSARSVSEGATRAAFDDSVRGDVTLPPPPAAHAERTETAAPTLRPNGAPMRSAERLVPPPSSSGAPLSTATQTQSPPSEIPGASPGAAPPAPNASASIASEVASIDRARQALRDRRASDALHELDVYRLTWPSGVLATEAAVLRIEAHLALGDRTSGIRAARAFLAATPSGRYAARVRALFNPAELE